MTEFTTDRLLHSLQRLAPVAGYHVAYSGGMDSHVLLHAMAALRTRPGVAVSAVHVNHGLHAAADGWQQHCAAVCAALDLPFTALRVQACAQRGESPEAAARAARYRALADWLPAGHGLLSAQHRDDQAETLLIQLLRGSGVHGLAAMPETAALGRGLLLRPLLTEPRAQLRDYAEHAGLQWVEDPSNDDVGFTRNFLRHRILPVLAQRWPAASASLARSAAHQAEAAALLDELAAADLAGAEDAAGTVSCAHLLALSPARRHNALREWLRRGCGRAPSAAVLERIGTDLLYSRPDAQPCVRWAQHELRRYRDRLYLLGQPQADVSPDMIDWIPGESLELPGHGGVLRARTVTGAGVRRALVGQQGVRIGRRRGGERCRPAGRAQHHTLKHLFQESAVPPWLRARIPLIYIGDELAAVAGLWTCEPFLAGPDEADILFEWQLATRP